MGTYSFFKHSDDRRTIYDWADGDFKAAKALIAGENCIVGDHYHKRKDEQFFLLIGTATKVVIGGEELWDIEAPCKFHVQAGSYHRFELTPGSILLGTASEPFDPSDEMKGKP